MSKLNKNLNTNQTYINLFIKLLLLDENIIKYEFDFDTFFKLLEDP